MPPCLGARQRSAADIRCCGTASASNKVLPLPQFPGLGGHEGPGHDIRGERRIDDRNQDKTGRRLYWLKPATCRQGVRPLSPGYQAQDTNSPYFCYGIKIKKSSSG
jgi:hypothetical protein